MTDAGNSPDRNDFPVGDAGTPPPEADASFYSGRDDGGYLSDASGIVDPEGLGNGRLPGTLPGDGGTDSAFDGALNNGR